MSLAKTSWARMLYGGGLAMVMAHLIGPDPSDQVVSDEPVALHRWTETLRPGWMCFESIASHFEEEPDDSLAGLFWASEESRNQRLHRSDVWWKKITWIDRESDESIVNRLASRWPRDER